MHFEDPSLTWSINSVRKAQIDRETFVEQTSKDYLPETLMSRIEPYAGNGGARITVSGTLSHNKDFCKAEAFVSISVSCNNDLDSVRAVHEIVRPLVEELVTSDLEVMKELRDSKRPVPQQEESKISIPPAKGPKNPGMFKR